MEEQRSQRGCIAGRMPAGLSPRAAMHDRLFADGAQLDDLGLHGMAGSLGIDLEHFASCLGDDLTAESIRRDADNAKALGLNATPSFLLGPRLPSGEVRVTRAFSGARPVDEFRAEFDRAAGEPKRTSLWKRLVS